MQLTRLVAVLLAVVVSLPLALAVPLLGLPEENAQHGGTGGHLPPVERNVEVVGQLTFRDASAGRVSDVAALGAYAYLGAYWEPDCKKGGVYVVDISDPSAPRQVQFIKTPDNVYVSEGVQALSLDTAHFQGDLLVYSNEICDRAKQASVGGVTLVDVTDPRHPVKLAENAGDFTPPAIDGADVAHTIHSAFAWQAGSRAFVVTVDVEEREDVDILEITDPRRPVLLRELDLNDLDIEQPGVRGADSSLHDVTVKLVDGTWIMLLAYWDGGYVQLDVDDPAAPVFIDDTDFTFPDPELAAHGITASPEGNAHQAEFSHGNAYFVATDEDFSPVGVVFQIASGTNAGEYDGDQFAWTVPISSLADAAIAGPTIYGGYACADDVASIPPPSALDGVAAAGEDRILVVQRGPVQDPDHAHAACFFSEKVEAAQNAGYDAVIVANHHTGSGAGDSPDAAACGSQGHEFAVTIPGACLGHRAFHLLFNSAPAYDVPYAAGTEPAIGTIGERVRITEEFNGWGYVHLYDAAGAEIDTYAIPEAMDPAYSTGYGDLTVHEVATDPDEDLAYFSYYAGGFRVARFGSEGIAEVGAYIDADGSNFWGVEVWEHPETGVEYVLASDRDSGLWIFQYTGP